MSKSNRFAHMAPGLKAQRDTPQEPSQAAPPAEIVPGDDSALSGSEAAALGYYEGVIERGLKTFFEVGAALLRVRDLRLYRVEYETFEAYCDERWGISRPRAYQFIEAAEVHGNLSTIVDISPPVNEAQARPLSRLKDPDQQRQAWQRVVERAAGARITARLVDQVVDDLLAELIPQLPPPQNGVEIIDQEAEEVQQDAAPSDTEEAAASASAPHAAMPFLFDLREPTADDEDVPDWYEEPEDLADPPVRSASRPSTPAAPASAPDVEEDTSPHPLQEPEGGWPDDLFDLHEQIERQGYELQADTDSRLTYRHMTFGTVVHVVKPPDSGKVKVRVVANKDDDWSDVAERLALVGVELDKPRPGHLPKYPETQRAYGTLDLNTKQLDQVAGLQAELAKAQAAQRQVMDILHEYQEQITRAQKYKPTSDRGEAVSPLLRALELVALTIQNAERKGREKA